MKSFAKIFLSVAALSTLCALPASAQTQQFDKDHPRRAEVIQRTKNEKARNNGAYANGKITGNQDKQLNKEDNAIRRQQRRQAAANGGYITKAQKAKDNREENRVNRQRANDVKRDAK